MTETNLAPPIRGNPRDHFKGKHRERGKQRYSYTAEDVARAAGLKVSTVRALGGRLLRDLSAIVALVNRSRGRRGEPPLW